MGANSRLDFGDTSPERSLMHGSVAAPPKADFSGWATRSNVLCEDGRTILPDAFKHQDQMKVPLVWRHGHDDVANVLGHAILTAKDGDVWTEGFFNETENAKTAKALVEHGDINMLSIFANKLKEAAKKVSHGLIREVSLVMAGANPKALIENVAIQHGDGTITEINDEVIIHSGETLLRGGSTPESPIEFEIEDDGTTEAQSERIQHAFDSMTEEQQEAVEFLVGAALSHGDKSDGSTLSHSGAAPDNKETRTVMSRNAFEEQNGSKAANKDERIYLDRETLDGIKHDAMTIGSLKKAVENYALAHGIDNVGLLFPDARAIAERPEFDKRRTEWVAQVMGAINKVPFSRIKNLVADITHDEARARGYIKGNFKKEEFFSLSGRVTTPTTVYKKQKLDRDDILDVTDFDLVAWLKAEMRGMLEEEIARAILISDGRAVDDPDKIKDPAGSNEGAGIRSILNDHALYAHQVGIAIDDAAFNGQAIADEILLSMGQYKGTGQPTLYTTLPLVTKLLLTRDEMGRRLWRTKSELATELGVSNIVEVEVMEGQADLVGIIVNLRDYTAGADRGGDVSMFDDFDIDYNQEKYLIETRLSGALTKIRAALVLKKVAGNATRRTPVPPTFNKATGEITVPNTVGVSYRRTDTNAVVTNTVIELDPYQELSIEALPTAGNYLDSSARTDWSFRNGRQYSGRDTEFGDAPGSVA